MWADSSAIARGVVLTDPDTEAVLEDASCLRTDEDADMHINMAEPDATVSGVNMTLVASWRLQKLDVRTHSVTVQRWLIAGCPEKQYYGPRQSEMLILLRTSVP